MGGLLGDPNNPGGQYFSNTPPVPTGQSLFDSLRQSVQDVSLQRYYQGTPLDRMLSGIGRVTPPTTDVQQAGAAQAAAQQPYQPLLAPGGGAELARRLGLLGEATLPYLGGGGPAGALTAGAKGAGSGAASAAATFAEQLKQLHLAQPDALPLSGAKAEVTPPPHITNMDEFNALVQRNADLDIRGAGQRDWYPQSGAAIHYATGGDVPTSQAFTGAASTTSPQTDVASNATHAITLHNQAMAGAPLSAGRFPNVMGPRVAQFYYGGQTPVGGEKTGPFYNAMGAGTWMSPQDIAATPTPHTFVNDIWNMRKAEYPGATGLTYHDYPGIGHNGGPPLDDAADKAFREANPLYNGSPTLGQHNFTRILSDATARELQLRTGMPWLSQQEQAAGWTGIKSLVEGTPPEVAGMDFSHGLQSNYGQLSWESAPGQTAENHLPEYATASQEDKQAFHDAIKGVLVDDQGRDIIARHLGMLTGPTFDAPGYFKGISNPGSQSQVALGQAPGGWAQGVDPASHALANASELVRGLLLRQDAVAWHKPTYMGDNVGKLGNLVDVNIGRPLTPDETISVAEAMHDRLGGNDFHSPIGTPGGFRFLNVPDYSGVSNVDFQKAVGDVVGNLPWEGEARLTDAHSDGGYFEHNWKDPSGEDYLAELGRQGSPDLQRAAHQLLATLGPKIGQVEDDFQRTLGWTPDRSTRVWETNPDIQRYRGAVVPSPRRPWLNPPPGLLGPTP